MSQLNLETILGILKEFTSKKKALLEVILVGGLSLHYYGMKEKATVDDVRKTAEDAIKNSPKDTALLIFKKNVEIFVKRLEKRGIRKIA